MKSLSMALVFLLAAALHADELGKILPIHQDQTTSHYDFGVHYSYDSGPMDERFQISWNIFYDADISATEWLALPSSLKWNLYDMATHRYWATWAGQPVISKGDLRGGSLGINGELAKFVIGNQSTLMIVFADTQNNPLYHLDVGGFCKSQPSYFLNLTDMNKKCDAVTVAEIDGAKNLFCQESAKELGQLLKDALVGCSDAQKSFLERGCGVFNCP